MAYALAANLIMLLHFGFIAFVLFGGLLLWRWPWLIWAHLPMVGWGFYISLTAGICPLTPWENKLRHAAGQQGYDGGFTSITLLR